MVDDFDRQEHLEKVHKKRKQKTTEKVDEAIKYLLKNNKKITLIKYPK